MKFAKCLVCLIEVTALLWCVYAGGTEKEQPTGDRTYKLHGIARNTPDAAAFKQKGFTACKSTVKEVKTGAEAIKYMCEGKGGKVQLQAVLGGIISCETENSPDGDSCMKNLQYAFQKEEVKSLLQNLPPAISSEICSDMAAGKSVEHWFFTLYTSGSEGIYCPFAFKATTTEVTN